MFELEKAIIEWRQQMLAAGIKSPVPLEELENHLREEVRRQIQSGISAQPAFEAAAQKLGRAAALKNEFELVQRTASAGERKAFKILLASSLISLFMFALPIFKLGTCGEMNFQQLFSCSAAIAVAILLCWGGWFGYGFFPVILNRRVRTAVFISNVILALLWELAFLYLIAPRAGLNLEELVVALIWNFVTPQGLLVGLFAGIERAAARRVPHKTEIRETAES